MTTHIAAFGLRKSYRKGKIEVPVLHGVDMEAARGELVAVIGASGSGKSTMLHLLGLLDQPDAGRVELDGRRIDDRPDRERDRLRNRTFGFIFQFYHLLPELTALENVMMPHLIRSGLLAYIKERKAIRRDAQEMLERVGLGHRLTHRPTELSGGEMQRAAIARALVAKPEILLADEPTGNLDTKTAAEVFALLRRFNREYGCAVLVVTHDPRLSETCDRTITLVDGRIVADERHSTASAPG